MKIAVTLGLAIAVLTTSFSPAMATPHRGGFHKLRPLPSLKPLKPFKGVKPMRPLKPLKPLKPL